MPTKAGALVQVELAAGELTKALSLAGPAKKDITDKERGQA
jgi:hypothetical protein